jgi:D-serine deaminase-like pyridoxal phosphate-dependent protein
MNNSALDQIDTPAVVIDYGKMLANIHAARDIAAQNGVALRPHIKTHKCFEIARLQLAEGAAGITASKPEEAMRFIEAGFRSITVAYPIVAAAKLHKLLATAREHDVELRVIMDSSVGVAVLRQTVQQIDHPTGVFLKIDVGLHRVGLSPDAEEVEELARQIAAAPGLRFAGLLSHAGHAYGAADHAEVAQIAREEAALLSRARNRLEAAGIAVTEVSVGSTPTFLASKSYGGITEIRPGNYVFMDRTPLRLGLIPAERIALTVLATVVSVNQHYAILDAGSKVLSSDRGPHGTGGHEGFGLAYPTERYLQPDAAAPIEKLSEEHGFLRRPTWPARVGDRVRIIPNHSCAVVNLADELVVVHGDATLERWRVAARGAVH